MTGPRSHSVAEVGLEVIWQGVRELGRLGGPSVRERGCGLSEAVENVDAAWRLWEAAWRVWEAGRQGEERIVVSSPWLTS